MIHEHKSSLVSYFEKVIRRLLYRNDESPGNLPRTSKKALSIETLGYFSEEGRKYAGSSGNIIFCSREFIFKFDLLYRERVTVVISNLIGSDERMEFLFPQSHCELYIEIDSLHFDL
jgi:hypothetical protein